MVLFFRIQIAFFLYKSMLLKRYNGIRKQLETLVRLKKQIYVI